MAELSGITVDGTLVPEAVWKAHITNLQASVNDEAPLTDERTQISAIQLALTNAVKHRIAGRKFGILLSGGIDSSLLALICKQLGKEFTCYNVGIDGSPDVEAAQQAASMLGLKLKQRIYRTEELPELFGRTAKILPHLDVVSLGVGAVELAAIELAVLDGTRVLMGGLGSEELFAGYARHAQAKDINQECWAGLFNMHARDLVRDAAIAQHLHVELLTPFLDPALIAAAMRIPGDAKIVVGEKKVILRKAAEHLGLPKEISWRKKQAAQYGSKFDAVLEKLAKRAGVEKRAYVEGLC